MPSFDCQLCHKTFVKKSNLEQHHRATHQGVRYSCLQCPKSFTRRDALTRHQTACKGRMPAPRHLCDICNTHFSSAFGLRRHTASVHNRETFSCKLCRRNFTRLYVRDNHEKLCAANGTERRASADLPAVSSLSSSLGSGASVGIEAIPLVDLLEQDYDLGTLDRLARQLGDEDRVNDDRQELFQDTLKEMGLEEFFN